MKENSRRSFNRRAFVSLTAVLALIGLPITGIANHCLQFEPMTRERHAWMSAHNSLGLVFVVFMAWHVALNRRALLHYARGLTGRLALVSRETLCAALLVGLVMFVMIGHAFLVP